MRWRGLLATIVAATAGVAAIAGAVMVEDRWDRPPLAEPLERLGGYREHKRTCLDLGVGEDRRETRARSC